MKKKTIAIVINASWNIFNFRLGLFHALQKEGYKIVVSPREMSTQNNLRKWGLRDKEI